MKMSEKRNRKRGEKGRKGSEAVRGDEATTQTDGMDGLTGRQADKRPVREEGGRARGMWRAVTC
jgi:hypothetical protein